MARNPRWMNDIVIDGPSTSGLSVDAAGRLLAALASDSPATLVDIVRRLPTSDANVEERTIAGQLARFADAVDSARAGGQSNTFEHRPRPPSRRLRFELRPSELGGTSPSGLPAMRFSVQIEELDGTHWGFETEDETTGAELAKVALSFITERKPLSWIKDELRRPRST